MTAGSAKTSDSLPLEVRLGRKTLLVTGLLGIVGSLTVVTGNTIMYAYGEEAHAPQWALNTAYWAGSMALAFAGVGFYQTYVALRPAGDGLAMPPAILLAYFFALGSAGHGSFFAPWELEQALLDADIGAQEVNAISALKADLQLHNNVLLLVPFTCLAIGSLWYSYIVFFKATLYPRWMGCLNLFLIAVSVFAAVVFANLTPLAETVLRGLGFHLGALMYFAVSLAVLLRRSIPDPDSPKYI